MHMNYDALNLKRSAEEFAVRAGIDMAADVGDNNWTPRLAELDDTGATSQQITATGADYFLSQLEYREGDEVKATRMTAEILPGNRTELAYWAEAAPTKQLAIHKGSGYIVVASPLDGEISSLPIDATTISETTLPSGCFYTIRADANGVEALVVSGFYDKPVDWGELETAVQPGASEVQTADGLLQVPTDFSQL
jgi:hypothetical protein